MHYLIILFATLVGTIFITPYFIDLFNRIKIVDLPDGMRKLHSTPVPRMGGLLIFVVFIASIFIFYGDINSIRYFLLGIVVIFALGAYDDLLGTGWALKFIYQILAAILLLLFLLPKFTSLYLFTFDFSIIPGSILLVIFIVGTINAFNLLDGLDGLVSGISLLIFTLLFFVGLNYMDTFSLVVLSSAMGCLIGFLKYNGYPARIFLGDSGSFLLGYLVVGSALLLSINKHTSVLDLTFPVILLAVPIADTLKVMAERIITGKHPFLADRTHIHHIIFSQNIRHKTTVFVITIYSLVFAANALVYKYYSELYGIIIFFVLILPLIFANWILKFMINTEKLVKIGRAINRFPQFLLNYFKIIILPLVTVFTVIYLVLIFLGNEGLKNEFLFPSLIILLLLLIFTLVNYNKNKILTDVVVFFNILIFFIINQSDSILYKDIYELPVVGNLNYNLLVIGILLPVIGFFLVFRDRINPLRGMLFSGFDLVIVLVIILLTLTSGIIPISRSYVVADTIFRSYLIYMFYKILINIEPRFRVYLYIFSFFIVISSQASYLFFY